MSKTASGKALIGVLERSAEAAKKWLIEKTPLKSFVDWAVAFSLWPVHLTTSCCGCEFGATWSPRFDAERYGALPFHSPRQCNLIIIEGTVTRKMARAVKIVWEQMPYPKYAIIMGACGLDGGLFYNSYNIVRPWEIVPADVFIPGCPPRPEALARAIIMLQQKIRKQHDASKKIVRGTNYPEKKAES